MSRPPGKQQTQYDTAGSGLWADNTHNITHMKKHTRMHRSMPSGFRSHTEAERVFQMMLSLKDMSELFYLF